VPRIRPHASSRLRGVCPRTGAILRENGRPCGCAQDEASPSFQQQFGVPAEQAITLDHSLGRVLPIGRKMTRPTTISITDRNGQAHECLGEAFDTTFNVLLLVYPVKALAGSDITRNYVHTGGTCKNSHCTSNFLSWRGMTRRGVPCPTWAWCFCDNTPSESDGTCLYASRHQRVGATFNVIFFHGCWRRSGPLTDNHKRLVTCWRWFASRPSFICVPAGPNARSMTAMRWRARLSRSRCSIW
jgi:hypothetical protein